MIADLRAKLSKTRHLRFALGLVWEAARPWTIAWGVLLLIQGIVPALLVYITKSVVDGAAAVIGQGVSLEAALPVLVPAGIMAALVIAQSLMGAVSQWISTAQSELVLDHVKSMVHDRAVSADYGFYETSEHYDLLDQVNSQAASKVLEVLSSAGGAAQATVTLASVGGILLSYNLFIPLALFVSTIPALYVVVKHNNVYHAWWQGATPRRRRVQYYDQLLTKAQSAQEVRIYSLGDHLRTLYRTMRRDLFRERVTLLRKQVTARFGASLTALVVTGVAVSWVGLQALRGNATIGDIALFYQAFAQGQGFVTMLFQHLGQLYSHTLFLEHLHRFLGQEDTVLDPPDPKPFPRRIRQSVRFEDVSFAYPGTERLALDGFDLEIPAGTVTAIVGENGAGKSTFIKLLCRFYDPDRGRITVDGTDLRSFAQADLRRHISVMFQAPVQYQMTARENIALGDIETPPSERAVAEAARAGGAADVIGKLPDGYGALLGRWFEGGTELSGGEWQRVALARAFLRDAPLVILDEPTSAMDSWTETEWLTRFRQLVKGQTALIITHRFTTAMRADVIHVVSGGRILESGSHEDLVARGGHYAASWNAQMAQAGTSVGGDGDPGVLAPRRSGDVA